MSRCEFKNEMKNNHYGTYDLNKTRVKSDKCVMSVCNVTTKAY